MRIAISRRSGVAEESRYDHRLHGLLLVCAGQSCRQVAELFGEGGTTVQRWVRRFEHGGLESLQRGRAIGLTRACSRRRNGASCKAICVRDRESPAWPPRCGMVQCSLSTCAVATGSTWEYGNPKESSNKWAFGCASSALRSPKLIR